MATLDVEFEAVSDADGRFARLAQLLGLADADHARGKVEHLWMACTTRGEADLPQWLVEKHLGAAGPAAMVQAELARWGRGRGDSKMRRMHIRGATKRCLWLRNNQEQAPKGGKARAANASRAAGRFTSRALVEADQPEPAPSPSPSPSPSPESDLSLSHAIPPGPVPVPVLPAPGIPAPDPKLDIVQPGDAALAHRQALRVAIWSELAAARSAVASELKLPPGDRALMAFDPGENALAMRLLAARDSAELELIASQARKAIAVIAAEARATRSVEWLTGSVFESDRSWRRAIGKSLAEAKRPPVSSRSAPVSATAPVPTARETERPVMVSDAERAQAAEMALELCARLFGDGARTPPAPASSSPTPDQQPTPAKAAT